MLLWLVTCEPLVAPWLAAAVQQSAGSAAIVQPVPVEALVVVVGFLLASLSITSWKHSCWS